MRKTPTDIEDRVKQALQHTEHATMAERIAADCAWLEAVSYPGLRLLTEALADTTQNATLEPDALGLDLQHVSCVFTAETIQKLMLEKGRLFLRNVRHGLYLVPDSVRENYAIGCPVDPAFALGGERSKNPYVAKLEAAARDGVEVDDALWQALA